MPSKVGSFTLSSLTVAGDGTTSTKVDVNIIDSVTNAASAAGVVVTWTVSPATAGTITKTSNTDLNGLAETSFVAASATQNSIATITATTADDPTGKKLAVMVMPRTLEAVRILNADTIGDLTLDQYDIAAGVTVIVPNYTGHKDTDIIKFFWGGSDSVEFTATEVPYYIDVKAKMKPECLNDADYDISYSVSDSSGNVSYSKQLKVAVDNLDHTPETLPAPTAATAPGYPNTINMLSSALGVVVTIDDKSITNKDFVTYYWFAKDQNKVPLAASSGKETNSSASYTIKSDYFQGKKAFEGSLVLRYKVSRGGSTKFELSHASEYIVDTTPPGDL